ncbi:MAG: hypothetical protein ACJ71Z_04515 [Aeromicrobium sp.]
MTDQQTPAANSGAATARAALVALGILIGSLGSAGLGFWHRNYEPGEPIPYGTFSRIHGAWWAWHLFGGLANTLMAVSVAIGVCMLARHRGAVWATIGAAATVLGGMFFGAGVAAEGAAMGYAGDAHALPPQAGAALLKYINEEPGRYVVAILPGLILSSLGLLLISLALWISRSVPQWVPIALFAGTVLDFFAPISIGWIAGLPQVVGVLAIGWYVWARRGRGEPSVS